MTDVGQISGKQAGSLPSLQILIGARARFRKTFVGKKFNVEIGTFEIHPYS